MVIGLAMGLVGLDQISGQARYTGGVPELLDGIEIVLVAVGTSLSAFWILAPIMTIAALGILFVRKAVHAALPNLPRQSSKPSAPNSRKSLPTSWPPRRRWPRR